MLGRGSRCAGRRRHSVHRTGALEGRRRAHARRLTWLGVAELARRRPRREEGPHRGPARLMEEPREDRIAPRSSAALTGARCRAHRRTARMTWGEVRLAFLPEAASIGLLASLRGCLTPLARERCIELDPAAHGAAAARTRRRSDVARQLHASPQRRAASFAPSLGTCA